MKRSYVVCFATVCCLVMMGMRCFAGFWNSPVNYLPAESLVYVCVADEAKVLVSDGITGAVSVTIGLPSGSRPMGIVFRPDYSAAYVTDGNNGKIYVINDNAVSEIIDVSPASSCSRIGIHPSGKFAYVTSDAGLLVLDTDPASPTRHTVIGTITNAGGDSITFTPDGTRAYTSWDGSWGNVSKVTVIDTVTHAVVGIIQLPVPTAPQGVAATPDGTRVYVAGWLSHNVSVIDSDPSSATYNTVVTVVSVSGSARGIAITPAGNLAYVTLDSGGVDVIVTTPSSVNYNQVIAHIDAGPFNGVHDDVISLDGRFTYVNAGGVSRNVFIVDSEPLSATFNTVIKSTSIGQGLAGMAVRPKAILHCAEEVVVDNADLTGVEIVGTWTGSTSSSGYWPTNYLHDGNTGKGTKSVTFRPTLVSRGNYEVSIWYTAGSNRATNVPVDIVYAENSKTVVVNQRVNGGQWVVLGTNMFAAGTTGYVEIRTDGTTSGYVIADAVRFNPVGILSTPVVTVAATDATAGEPGTTDGTGTFTFTRTAPLTAALTVNFTVGGSATAGSDYTFLGTTVSFAAGSATATKTVSVINDSLVEGDETVVVTLGSGADYTVGSPSSATVTIKDDDLSEVIVDNADINGVTIVGMWTGSTSSPGYWPTNYLHDGNTDKGTKSVTFRPTLLFGGNYEVSIWYTEGSNRATNVPMDIVYEGNSKTVVVNQRVKGSQWVVLGTNSFAAGTTGYVRIRTDGTTSGYVIADAVRFKLIGGTLAAAVTAVVTSFSELESMNTLEGGEKLCVLKGNGSVLEPIEVQTSDPEPDTEGWKAVDGDPETFWQGQTGARGWWLMLNYGKNVKAQDVQVQWAEDSATNLLLLGSEDADQWYEVAPLLKEGPVTFGYLWFVLPEGEGGIAPKVSEIRVNPAE